MFAPLEQWPTSIKQLNANFYLQEQNIIRNVLNVVMWMSSRSMHRLNVKTAISIQWPMSKCFIKCKVFCSPFFFDVIAIGSVVINSINIHLHFNWMQWTKRKKMKLPLATMWISMKSNYIKINCEWCISNGNVMNAFAVVRCYEFIVCTFERCSLSYRLVVRFSDCTVRLCATCPVLSEQWTQDQKLLFLRREWKDWKKTEDQMN